MFTGIIERQARVVSLRRGAAGAIIALDLGDIAAGVTIGDSIAVNGACLTAVTVYAQATTHSLFRTQDSIQRALSR